VRGSRHVFGRAKTESPPRMAARCRGRAEPMPVADRHPCSATSLGGAPSRGHPIAEFDAGLIRGAERKKFGRPRGDGLRDGVDTTGA